MLAEDSVLDIILAATKAFPGIIVEGHLLCLMY